MSQLRKTLDNKNPPQLVLVAGAVAGATEVITTYPLDTIKTHMQIKKNGNSIKTAINIIKNSGISGLYYGVIPSLAQVAGKASLRFTLYEKIKESLKGRNNNSNFNNLIAGLSSGAIEAMIWTSPTERVKIIQQNSKKHISTKNVIVNIIKKNGIRGLYIGTVPTIYKQSLSVGTRFWLYNIIKDLFEKDGKKIDSTKTIFTGALAGGLSTTFNHPFDVVKSRIQSDTCKGKTFSIMKNICNKEGFFALFSGLSPRFYRVAIAQGITFYLYESIIHIYHNNI
jgi:nitrogen regulatory protein PII-like uncharacterized protein